MLDAIESYRREEIFLIFRPYACPIQQIIHTLNIENVLITILPYATNNTDSNIGDIPSIILIRIAREYRQNRDGLEVIYRQ